MPVDSGPVTPTCSWARFLPPLAIALSALLGAATWAAPDPARAPAGTILLKEWDAARDHYRHATLSPDGKTEVGFATPHGWPATTGRPSDVLRSPDGKRAVLVGTDTRPRGRDGTDPPQVPAFLCSFPQGKDLTPFGVDMEPAYWSADGGRLVVREYPPDHDTNPGGTGAFLSIDLKSGTRTAVPIPVGHWLHDQSPDGKQFLTTGKDPAGKLKGNRLFLLDRDGTVIRPLTDETVVPGRAQFGPDGRGVLLRAAPRSAKPVPGVPAWKLYRTGTESPKLELLTEVPDSAAVGGFALSPDRRWVAFDRHPRVPVNLNPRKVLDPEAETGEGEFAVVVVGLDGRGPRTVRSVKTTRPFSVQLQVIDWR